MELQQLDNTILESKFFKNYNIHFFKKCDKLI